MKKEKLGFFCLPPKNSFLNEFFYRMSLWKLFEGARYCGGVCEHSLKRYKRIRDNRDKLVELGFMTLDEPLESHNFNNMHWIEINTSIFDY